MGLYILEIHVRSRAPYNSNRQIVNSENRKIIKTPRPFKLWMGDTCASWASVAKHGRCVPMWKELKRKDKNGRER